MAAKMAPKFGFSKYSTSDYVLCGSEGIQLRVFGVKGFKFHIFDFMRKFNMAEIQYGGQNCAQIPN